MSTERDTHFLGFAKLQLEKLKPDLALLFAALGERQIQREKFSIEEAESILQTSLACHAYDLVFHLLKNSDSLYLDMAGYYSDPPDEDVHQNIAHLPDLTEWPEETS